MEKVKIPVGEGKYLVAEICSDPSYKEIYVYLEVDGYIYQDLAIVGQQYHYDDDHEYAVMEDGRYYVTVYGDCNDEDYTNKFIVEEYKEEE